jgi:hypothetical protein
MKNVNRLVITFTREGLELAISYSHSEADQISSPGSKRRVVSGVGMASKALEAALASMDEGKPAWGGYRTNERVSTDHILIDRRVDAKAS